MVRLAKARFVLVWPIAIWLLVAAHTTERRLHVGLALVLLGELLRLWANGYVGHVKVNRTQQWRGDPRIGQLVTAGPYAFVRHPLYLGTLLIGAGFCLMAGNVWLILAALAFFLSVYRRKMVHEEALLKDELGTPYLIYQAAVPRWLPTWRRYPSRQSRWSWRGLWASREWKTVLWVVVIAIAVYLREEIVQEGEFFPSEERLKQVALLVTGIVLMLSDGVVELFRRWKRRAMPPSAAS